jgi:hypothetical protein
MRAIAILLLFGTTGLGADITGIWLGKIPGRRGDSQDVAFQFIQKGATLSGKLYGDYQSTPIVEGKISDGEVSFVVISQEQAGNQINDTIIRFTGCFQGPELELNRQIESATNAGNGGKVAFKGNQSQTIRLKRLYSSATVHERNKAE